FAIGRASWRHLANVTSWCASALPFTSPRHTRFSCLEGNVDYRQLIQTSVVSSIARRFNGPVSAKSEGACHSPKSILLAIGAKRKAEEDWSRYAHYELEILPNAPAAIRDQ